MEIQDYPYDGRQLCKKEDPELFFPETYSLLSQVNVAKAICNKCPLIAECRDYALANPDLDGIWGGTTPRERKCRTQSLGKSNEINQRVKA